MLIKYYKNIKCLYVFIVTYFRGIVKLIIINIFIFAKYFLVQNFTCYFMEYIVKL